MPLVTSSMFIFDRTTKHWMSLLELQNGETRGEMQNPGKKHLTVFSPISMRQEWNDSVIVARSRTNSIDSLCRNIWMGVSVENQKYAFRIDHLRQTRAHIKFLSLEPLLGPLDNLDLSGIDWVIVGGESGPKARPVDPAWVRDIRNQCLEAGVAFFFKQWGGKRKSKTGRKLDGRTWNEYPDARLQPALSGHAKTVFLQAEA